MSSLKQRFILAGAALPILVAAVLFLPYLHYAVIGIAAAVFSGLGALEISRMFTRRGATLHPVQAFLSGAVFPLSAWIDETGLLGVELFTVIPIFLFCLIIARQAFIFTTERLKRTLEKTAAAFLLVVYPGFFMSYIIRICSFPLPTLSVLLFFSLIFANDSLAYGAGMLLGAGNRNIFAASPNKSVAGLFGGVAGAAGAAYVFYALRPDIFSHNAALPLAVATLCACAADIGDLAESAMKRSAEIKDSGTLMKGRGGIMDSIDSILFGAPVFYYAFDLVVLQGMLT